MSDPTLSPLPPLPPLPQGPSNPYVAPMLADLEAAPQDPARLPGNPYVGSMMAELGTAEKERETQFAAAYRAALRTDPAIFAEAKAIAQQMGEDVAPDAVLGNIKVAREVVKARALRYEELRQRSPILAEQLAKTDFVRIARDDLDNLETTESTFGWLKRNVQAGQAANMRGYIGTRKALGIATPEEEESLIALEQLQREANMDAGVAGNVAQTVGQMVDTVSTAAAIGGAAAAPMLALGPAAPIAAPKAFTIASGAALFTQSAMIEGGNAYLDMIDNGYDHQTAAAVALGIGLVNGSLELVGASAVSKPFKAVFAREAVTALSKAMTRETAARAFGVFVRDYAKSLGAEVFTETAQEAVNIAGEDFARRISRPDLPGPTTGQVIERLGDIFTKTAMSMGVLSVPGPALKYAADAVRAGQATQQARVFDEMARLAGESQSRKLDGDGYGSTVRAMAEANGAPLIYVDAKALGDILRQQDKSGLENGDGLTKSAASQLNEKLPGIADQLEQAERDGGDVVIRTDDWASKLAGTELDAILRPHMRFDPEGISLSQAEEYRKSLAEMQAGMQGEKGVGAAADRAFAESAAKVRQTMEAYIGKALADAKAVGVSKVETQGVARIGADMVATLAEGTGKTPEQLFEEFRPAFLGGVVEQDAQTLQQPAPLKTDTPEFRAWFGESKVVDEAGKPLVVYHGTDADFTAFNADKSPLMFFSENRDTAGAYASDRSQGRGGRVVEAWVSATNPATAEDVAKVDISKEVEALAEINPNGAEYLADRAAFIKKRIAGAQGWLFTKAAESGVWRDVLVPALKRAGFDSLRLEDAADTGGSLAVFDPTQIKSVNNRGTFDPNDPNILRQPSRGQFGRNRLAILFGEKADSSTILHELTHWYVEVLLRMAQAGNVPPAIQAQIDTLFQRWGVADVEAWNALSSEQQRKHLEDISYNAEDYFATGEAPSKELASLFARIRTWIVRVYRAVRDTLNASYRRETGADLPALTPELRQFFDRMLASQQAIELAEAERGLSSLFLDEKARKAAGITEEQWANVQKLDAEARDQAVADLTAKAVRGMGAFEGARLRVVKEWQQKLAGVRAKVRAEVEAEVAARPVYRAQAQVRYGTVIDENGQEQSAKLDTDAVRRILGTDADKLPAGYTRKGGVSPDATAELFGYQNGEAMLRDFLAAPQQEEAVNARTDERMEAEHSELSDPKALRRAIEAALHNVSRSKVIATELRHLLKSTQSTSSMIAAAKEAARRKLLTMEVGRISARQFVQAEARAAKQAREALASGNVQEAIEAQRRYLLQHELTRQALDIEKEVDRFVEAVDDRYFADDEKVIKGRNLDIVQAARSILGEHGLASGRRYDKALAYLTVLKEQNPELHAELEGLVADATVNAKDYRSTTLEGFRVMVNAVESLWDRAKRAQEIEVNGQRMSKAVVVSDLLAQAQKRYGKAKAPTPQTEKARRAARWSTGPALLKRVEHWTSWLDGGKEGPWTRYVWQPMRKRFDAYMASREQRIKALRDIIKGIDLPTEAIDAPELGTQTFKSTAELLGAMLHMGNESNLQKLLGGYGWGARMADGTVDTTGWWRLMDRLMKSGRITKAHVDALQSMWDLMEDLKGEAQQVNRSLYGTYFEEIQAQPFETPWGRYKGGYAPAKPDPTLNPDLGVRDGLEAIQDAERNFRESMPSAGRGFTKTRNQSTRPLLLDVRLVGGHLDEVLRFVHLQPSLRDVASLLRNQELAGYLNSVDRTAINDVLVPWLGRVAANRTTKPGQWSTMDSLFNWLRRTTGFGAMFANLTNAAQQVTGLSNAAVYVPWKHLRGAMWDGWTSATAERIAKLSKFMDQRLNSQVGQLQDDIDLALQPSKWGAVKDWTNRNGYFLQRMFQNRVDPIVWQAAFNHSLEQSGATETDAAAVAKAVDHADAVVRKSQGSQTAIDIAAYEASTPFARLFTQFSGYFNTVLNQIASQVGATAKARAAVHALVLPTVVAGAIAAALNGREDIDDKDGDGYSDEYLAWFFGQQARAAAALVPGFGPNLMKAMGSLGIIPGVENPGNRMAMAPAFSMVESALRTASALPRLAAGNATPRQVRDFWRTMSFTGIPLTQVGTLVTLGAEEQR